MLMYLVAIGLMTSQKPVAISLLASSSFCIRLYHLRYLEWSITKTYYLNRGVYSLIRIGYENRYSKKLKCPVNSVLLIRSIVGQVRIEIISFINIYI